MPVNVGNVFIRFAARNGRFLAGLRRNAQALKRQELAVQSLQRNVRAFNSSARRMTSSLFSMQGAILGLVGAGGLVALGREFIQASDTMQLASSRLRIVTKDTKEFATAQQRVFEVAQETRLPLNNLIDLYARVARSTRALGKTQTELIPFVRSVAQAIITSGASAQEANAGLIQFSQGLAAGALRGDEFRSVSEQLPRLAQAIADGLGFTIGQLRAFAHEGRLTTDIVFQALEGQASRIESEFRKIPRTVGQAMQQLRNVFLRAANTINPTTDSSKALIASIDRLRTIVSDRDLLTTFTKAIQRVVDGFVFLLEHINAVGHALTLLFGVALFQSRVGIIIRSLARVTIGMISLRGAIGGTARSFISFYTLPTRVFMRIRFGIESTALRFLFLWDSARRTGAGIVAALRAPIATISGLSRRVFTLRNALTAAGVAARTVFAVGMTAAATAARAFGVAIRLVGTVLRTLSPLLIIEGLIQLVRFFFNLQKAIQDVGSTFNDVALVAGADFASLIAESFVNLLSIIANVINAIAKLFVNGFRKIAELGREAFLAVFQGKEFTFSFGEAIRSILDDVSETLFKDLPKVNFNFAQLLGLDQGRLRRAREALSQAGRQTLNDFLETFGFGEDGRPTPTPSPPPTLDTNEIKQRAGQIVQTMNLIKEGIVDGIRAIEDFAVNAIAMFDGVSDSMNNLIKSLGNLARSLARDIIRAGVHAGLVKVLPESIGSGLQTRQEGGFTRPGFVLAGERGAEVLDLATPARVYSNQALGAALRAGGENISGRGTNITVNFSPVIQSGMDANAVRAELIRAYPSFEQSIRSVIQRDVSRPSALRRAVRGTS